MQRIFVHPGIKKRLCETAGGDRAWLNKVRPYYGHNEHFHVRLFCEPGSPDCKPQPSTGTGDGCDKLDWWFNVALQPPKPGAKPPKPKPPMTLADMPNRCSIVAQAPAAVPGGSARVAGVAAAPAPAPGAVPLAFAPPASVPVPTFRP